MRAARQPGLGHRALDQRVADLEDAARGGFQKPGARIGTGRAIWIEGGPGQGAGAFDIGLARPAERRVQLASGTRIDGAESTFASAHRARADEHLAGNGHGLALPSLDAA